MPQTFISYEYSHSPVFTLFPSCEFQEACVYRPVVSKILLLHFSKADDFFVNSKFTKLLAGESPERTLINPSQRG